LKFQAIPEKTAQILGDTFLQHPVQASNVRHRAKEVYNTY